MGAVASLREFFARASPGIVAAYLFGRVARGTARPDSDPERARCAGAGGWARRGAAMVG